MKSILPILACLAMLSPAPLSPAQVPETDGAASSVAGEALMDRVVAAVDAHDSIAAKIRHRVELIGRAPLIGTGMYLQQGRGLDKSFRLELNLRTALFATSVQHVCDGSHLWILEDLDGNQNLTLLDVARLYRARPKTQGQVAPTAELLALAGMPKLLTRLQVTFVFDRVVESQLDELRVWSITGSWHPDRLKQFLPEQKEAIESGAEVDLSGLAPNLPHRVVLHVGADDLFPYRIEYWRRQVADNDDDSPGRPELMMVMELYEVQLGARIDPAQFVFRPGELRPQDRTKEILDRLGLEDPPPEEAKRVLRQQL